MITFPNKTIKQSMRKQDLSEPKTCIRQIKMNNGDIDDLDVMPVEGDISKNWDGRNEPFMI